jgi:hypothetical protein
MNQDASRRCGSPGRRPAHAKRRVEPPRGAMPLPWPRGSFSEFLEKNVNSSVGASASTLLSRSPQTQAAGWAAMALHHSKSERVHALVGHPASGHDRPSEPAPPPHVPAFLSPPLQRASWTGFFLF